MITVVRYSKTAFKPQYQSHHLEHIDYAFNKFNPSDFPEHLRDICIKQNKKAKKFYSEHIEDLQRGIWVFIDGYKCSQSLNHLKELVPCWEAELPDDTEVYSVNWDRKLMLNDGEVMAFGCYISESQLENLYNVRRFRKAD